MANSTPVGTEVKPLGNGLINRDWFGPSLLVGFMLLVFMGFYKAPMFPGDTFGVIIGYMSGWIAAVVNFKYGSTSGSRSKDQTIQDLVVRHPENHAPMG